MYVMYLAKSWNSSIVGLKVMILKAEFAAGGGAGAASSSGVCGAPPCSAGAGGAALESGAEFESMASSEEFSTDITAGKLTLQTQTQTQCDLHAKPAAASWQKGKINNKPSKTRDLTQIRFYKFISTTLCAGTLLKHRLDSSSKTFAFCYLEQQVFYGR